MHVVHDENGTITSIVLGQDKKYESLLEQHGQQCVYVEGATDVDPSAHYVDVEAKASGKDHRDCLCKKLGFTLTASKQFINADGSDEARIEGIPFDADVEIFCGSHSQWTGRTQTGFVEISSDAPAAFKVVVKHAHFNTSMIAIEAR